MGQDLALDQVDLWLAEAKAGGPEAALAARRAAALAERGGDGARALAALALAARLSPLDPAPRLAAARLSAEAGDFAAARTEAEAVLATSVDQAARARAAFMLGELSRALGENTAARSHFETALKIEDAILARTRGDPDASRWYARARGRLAELDAGAGDFARARAGAEAALALLRACAAQIGEPPELAADIADAEMRLGALELDDGRPTSALRRLGEAIGRFEALAATEQDEPHWRATLSDAWALAAEAEYARGDGARARTAMDKALHARIRLALNNADERWGLAGLWRTRAALLAALNDDAGAGDSLRQARALAEHLAEHGGEAGARFLIHTLLDEADHGLRRGALDTAHESAELALRRADTYARAPDADAAWLGEAGACWDRLGELARAARAPAQTTDAFARAAEFRRRAYQCDAQNPRFARALAGALVKLGEAVLANNDPGAARAAFHESARLRWTLAHADQENRDAALALATVLERLGLAARACGDRDAARGAWEDELSLAARLFGPDDPAGQRFCAVIESHLASLGGLDAELHRRNALARFDDLANAGLLTTTDAALRKKLWGG